MTLRTNLVVLNSKVIARSNYAKERIQKLLNMLTSFLGSSFGFSSTFFGSSTFLTGSGSGSGSGAWR